MDVGAESTLSHTPGAGAGEQVRLLVPVVRRLVREGIPVSAETYLPQVAQAALEAGASVINMTGIERSREIYSLAAGFGAAVIVSYVQGPNARSVDRLEFEGDPAQAVGEWFAGEVARARESSLERIVLDPGLGYYYRNLADGRKRVAWQMEMLLEASRIRCGGWPVCSALPHAFEFFGEEVRTAEPFFAVLAAMGGTDLFRTHEVSRVRAVLDTLGCLAGADAPPSG